MKNLGRIEDPKEIITKEFLEGGIGVKVNTLEDNLQMAESDIETLQTDVQGLKTDNTATKAAVKTLQDTYVPNTRKVNGKALDADITIDTAFYVNATISETDPTVVTLDKTTQEIITARSNKLAVYCSVANENIGAYLLQLVSDDLSGGLQFISPYIVGVAMDFDNPKQIVIYETGNGLKSRWKIRYRTLPTKTSQLTNDSGFLTSAPVESVNNKTGAVTLTATDVGAIPNTTSILDIKVATNISCPLSAWVSDTTTYTDYQFKANLTVAGATADYIPLVNFAPSEQESGNYIGATSGSGIVTIWCKSKPSGTITIPNIILTKEN